MPALRPPLPLHPPPSRPSCTCWVRRRVPPNRAGVHSVTQIHPDCPQGHADHMDPMIRLWLRAEIAAATAYATTILRNPDLWRSEFFNRRTRETLGAR